MILIYSSSKYAFAQITSQRRFAEAVEECIRAQNELTLADTGSNPLLKDLQVKVRLTSLCHVDCHQSRFAREEARF